jgi:tetratricopeptide (TPR) repeat protein
MTHVLLLALALGAPPTVNKEAQRYYNKSKIEYNAGEFEKALKDATEAYELEPAPGLLYNLGQCHRALHHWERAEFFYRGYLREKPDAPNREAVEALIAQMVARQQEEAAVAGAALPPAAAAAGGTAPAPVVPVILMAPEAAAAPAPKPIASTQPALPSEAVQGKSSGGPPAAFWWLGGSGVACAVVGTLFALGAQNQRNSDPTTNGVGNNPSLIFHQAQYQQFGQANTSALLADGLFIVGGGLIVAAIVVAVTAPSHSASTQPLAFAF